MYWIFVKHHFIAYHMEWGPRNMYFLGIIVIFYFPHDPFRVTYYPFCHINRSRSPPLGYSPRGLLTLWRPKSMPLGMVRKHWDKTSKDSLGSITSSIKKSLGRLLVHIFSDEFWFEVCLIIMLIWMNVYIWNYFCLFSQKIKCLRRTLRQKENTATRKVWTPR